MPRGKSEELRSKPQDFDQKKIAQPAPSRFFPREQQEFYPYKISVILTIITIIIIMFDTNISLEAHNGWS